MIIPASCLNARVYRNIPRRYALGVTAFGELIRTLRQQRHMTQRQLGEAVGVGQAAISKWEKGYTSPASLTGETLIRLALQFGITVPQLLVGADADYDKLHPCGPIDPKRRIPHPELSGPLGEDFVRLWNNKHLRKRGGHLTLFGLARAIISEKQDVVLPAGRKDRPIARPRREG